MHENILSDFSFFGTFFPCYKFSIIFCLRLVKCVDSDESLNHYCDFEDLNLPLRPHIMPGEASDVAKFLTLSKIPQNWKIWQNLLVHFSETSGQVSIHLICQSKSTTFVFKLLRGFFDTISNIKNISILSCNTNLGTPSNYKARFQPSIQSHLPNVTCLPYSAYYLSFVTATVKAVKDQGCDAVDKGFGLCLLKKCKDAKRSDRCGVNVRMIEMIIKTIWLIKSTPKMEQTCPNNVPPNEHFKDIDNWPGMLPMFC